MSFLLNLDFVCIVCQAKQEVDRGIYVCYRMDGSLFDLKRLNTRTKTFQNLSQEALFANDFDVIVHTEADIQLRGGLSSTEAMVMKAQL